MKMSSWKCVLVLCLLANVANAGTVRKVAKGPYADADHVIYTPPRGAHVGSLNKANLSYHGGSVITSARTVFLFWGPSFCSGGADSGYATTLQAYRNLLGTTLEYNTITQYSGIQMVNLGSGVTDGFDCSAPPVNVTDALVQSHVNAYLTTHTFNASTVYEVVIPSSSYSSSGTSTSCGGANLQYCAYHGSYGSGSSVKKYSIQPYPSCGGCQVPGWSDVQNQEHFVVHETREAVTNPANGGWWDNSNGFEADDKCAWTPTPFLGTGGYAYQYEWSNATGSCVATAQPACGESSCANLGGAYISHYTGANCTGTESYYTPYFSSDGVRRSWDGGGKAGTVLRTVTNMSFRDSTGFCHQSEWPTGNTLVNFVTIYRTTAPAINACDEPSCTALGGAYISHFTGSNCTGTESYYTAYFGFDGVRRSWDGGGTAGAILRTVTNMSYRDSTGFCYQNAWPTGNTLGNFVTIYR